MEPCLLAIDAGTTHCKAGLFSRSGRLLASARQPTQVRQSSTGYFYFEPAEIWRAVMEVCREVCLKVEPGVIAGIGVSSMAETGLLVDRQSGNPGSWLVPWLDKGALQVAQNLEKRPGGVGAFLKTGIYPNFKCGLAKIIWLRDEFQIPLEGMVWLSVADFIALNITGELATDYSLAGRTYAFDLDKKEWDGERLYDLGLDASIFPKAVASGETVGSARGEFKKFTGLKFEVPLVIAGHDHVCGSFAVGGLNPGIIFDSMGTAEAMLGTIDERILGESEARSGLTFGAHAARGRRYWMGGLSASGGSLEWARRVLGDPAISFEELEALASKLEASPTGIIYFPYLSGSGSPHTDPLVRAALVGIDAKHGREHLVRAFFEGTAYEMEFIRQAAIEGVGVSGETVIAAGGGSRSRTWMQIKADVSGCRFESLHMQETTLLGAALLAGMGAGIFTGEKDALAACEPLERDIYLPDENRHSSYRQIYENGFLELQSALRTAAKNRSY
jgi:sugar (pentulose or hexulose) kinase